MYVAKHNVVISDFYCTRMKDMCTVTYKADPGQVKKYLKITWVDLPLVVADKGFAREQKDEKKEEYITKMSQIPAGQSNKWQPAVKTKRLGKEIILCICRGHKVPLVNSHLPYGAPLLYMSDFNY